MRNRLSLPLIPIVISFVITCAEWFWIFTHADSSKTWIVVLLMFTKAVCWLFIIGQLKITNIHRGEDGRL